MEISVFVDTHAFLVHNHVLAGVHALSAPNLAHNGQL